MHRTPSPPSLVRVPRVLSVVVVLLAVALGSAACSTAPGPPAAPTGAFYVPGNGGMIVDWYAPSDNTGLTGYAVVAQPGNHTCVTKIKPGCVIGGLTNGTTYAVSVRSTGAGGMSGADHLKAVPGVPNAPGFVNGVIGDSTVTVSWTAPPAVGFPILGFVVVSNPGFIQCRSLTTTCTVSGLTNDTPYTFTVAAINAVGQGISSVASAPLTPSALSGGSPGITYLGPVNANQETTTGTVLQRDAGISVGLPSGRDLWIFGDTSSFSANASQSNAFIGGSTAAAGRYIPGRTPTALKDIQPAGSLAAGPNAAPVQFIPTPTDTVMPDGSGRACTTANGAVYTARWPTGAALLDNPANLLVTYTDVCVTTATNFTVEGWGWMIYNWRQGKIKTGPIDVFPPAANGAPLPSDRAYQSPIVANSQITFFTSDCTHLFIACTGGTVGTTTMADNALTMAFPISYVGHPAVTDGVAPWTPVNVSVAAYPSGLRLIEQTSIGGTFLVFSSATPTGPWHPFLSGTLPGCSTTPRGFCYAFVGHPELGSNSNLVVSYFKPDSPENANVGHVDLASILLPVG